ncbi:hypothetical protein Catovirus_1_224 [Catovirus CTV1]|uniref:Uncharacterized protein n=1 Tax=Catovirus CTV1 TaxID=1977631 RepID=A0A1V0S904_9VIRU|nr:hypothetical protein Catovirus_1_224 [Catovirus CTV1]
MSVQLYHKMPFCYAAEILHNDIDKKAQLKPSDIMRILTIIMILCLPIVGILEIIHILVFIAVNYIVSTTKIFDFYQPSFEVNIYISIIFGTIFCLYTSFLGIL